MIHMVQASLTQKHVFCLKQWFALSPCNVCETYMCCVKPIWKSPSFRKEASSRTRRFDVIQASLDQPWTSAGHSNWNWNQNSCLLQHQKPESYIHMRSHLHIYIYVHTYRNQSTFTVIHIWINWVSKKTIIFHVWATIPTLLRHLGKSKNAWFKAQLLWFQRVQVMSLAVSILALKCDDICLFVSAQLIVASGVVKWLGLRPHTGPPPGTRWPSVVSLKPALRFQKGHHLCT